MARILSRKQLKDRALLRRSRAQPITVGKTWWLQCEGTSHITLLESREMDAVFSSLSLFIQSRPQPVMVWILSRLLFLETPSSRHPEMCFHGDPENQSN